MKRLILCLLVLVVVAMSCERRAQIIPVNKFQRIYAEMFLADQWIEVHPQMRRTADTTLVYESIFRHYGYCLDDYYASVDYYMNHPDKYQKIIDGAIDWLKKRCADAEALRSEIQKLEARREELAKYADSLGYAELCAYIDSVLDADSVALRALMDSMGFHLPDSLTAVSDSLAVSDTLIN